MDVVRNGVDEAVQPSAAASDSKCQRVRSKIVNRGYEVGKQVE